MKSCKYMFTITLIASLSLNAGDQEHNNRVFKKTNSKGCRDLTGDDDEDYKKFIGSSAAIAIAQCSTSSRIQQPNRMITTSSSAPASTTVFGSPLQRSNLNMYVPRTSPVASMIQLDLNKEELPKHPKNQSNLLNEKK